MCAFCYLILFGLDPWIQGWQSLLLHLSVCTLCNVHWWCIATCSVRAKVGTSCKFSVVLLLTILGAPCLYEKIVKNILFLSKKDRWLLSWLEVVGKSLSRVTTDHINLDLTVPAEPTLFHPDHETVPCYAVGIFSILLYKSVVLDSIGGAWTWTPLDKLIYLFQRGRLSGYYCGDDLPPPLALSHGCGGGVWRLQLLSQHWCSCAGAKWVDKMGCCVV